MTTAPRSFDERNIDGDNNDDKDQDKFDEHRDNNRVLCLLLLPQKFTTDSDKISARPINELIPVP